jgi:hypothetical protein
MSYSADDRIVSESRTFCNYLIDVSLQSDFLSNILVHLNRTPSRSVCAATCMFHHDEFAYHSLAHKRGIYTSTNVEC